MPRFSLPFPWVKDADEQLDPQAVQADFDALAAAIPAYPTVLTSKATTAQGPGTISTDLVYTSVEVTLTPGIWLVWGQATMSSQTAADTKQLGLYNNTAGAAIADSKGPASGRPAVNVDELFVTFAFVTVTTSFAVRLIGYRNGASQISFGYGGGGITDEQRITAVKVG